MNIRKYKRTEKNCQNCHWDSAVSTSTPRTGPEKSPQLPLLRLQRSAMAADAAPRAATAPGLCSAASGLAPARFGYEHTSRETQTPETPTLTVTLTLFGYEHALEPGTRRNPRTRTPFARNKHPDEPDTTPTLTCSIRLDSQNWDSDWLRTPRKTFRVLSNLRKPFVCFRNSDSPPSTLRKHSVTLRMLSELQRNSTYLL